ncbi:MAG: DOMON domain-containing protein [Bacteroidota bacterium]
MNTPFIVKIFLLVAFWIGSAFSASNASINRIHRKGMIVAWEYHSECIEFTLEASTSGWVAIGFNSVNRLQGSYLIMARIREGQVEVVEHYIHHTGIYIPCIEMGVHPQIQGISGREIGPITQIKFSLPLTATHVFARDLHPGTSYTLLMAYSMEDDFLHQSAVQSLEEIHL